jgi:hypothetical protein
MKLLKGEASRDYGDVHTDIARVVQDAHRALGEVGDYLKLCSRRLGNFGREPLLNCGCGSDALAHELRAPAVDTAKREPAASAQSLREKDRAVARRTADRTPSLPIYWLLDQYIGSMLTHERALEIVAVGASTRCKEQNSCAPKSF